MHFYDSKWLLRKHRNLSTNRQRKPGITRIPRKCRYIQRSQRPKTPGITRNHRKTHADSEPKKTRIHPESPGFIVKMHTFSDPTNQWELSFGGGGGVKKLPKYPKSSKSENKPGITRNHRILSTKRSPRRVPKSLFLDPFESKNDSFKLFWGSDLIIKMRPGITRIHRNASIKRHRERAPKRTPKEWGEGPQAPKRPKIIKIRKQTRNHPESSNSIDKATRPREPQKLNKKYFS